MPDTQFPQPKAEAAVEVVNAALFFLNGTVSPKRKPTYAEAVRLVTAVARIRDSINEQLVKYYDWADVKDLSLYKRLDSLQALALAYSSKSTIEEPLERPTPAEGVEETE